MRSNPNAYHFLKAYESVRSNAFWHGWDGVVSEGEVTDTAKVCSVDDAADAEHSAAEFNRDASAHLGSSSEYEENVHTGGRGSYRSVGSGRDRFAARGRVAVDVRAQVEIPKENLSCLRRVLVYLALGLIGKTRGTLQMRGITGNFNHTPQAFEFAGD